MEVWPATAHNTDNNNHFGAAGNASSSVVVVDNPQTGSEKATVSATQRGTATATTMVTLEKSAANSGGFAVVHHGNTGGVDANNTSAHDQAQFEADKRAVYKHPLFPLLALLFERCELATQSSEVQSSDSFNMDIQAFVQHQERDRKPFLTNDPEIDGLMIKAIQVLRIHLLELEKVQELCKDFCNRYITCLKGKMQSENLLRSDYSQGGSLGPLENNNNMMNHSESGSNSNSPIQSYAISPNQQQLMPTVPSQGGNDLNDGSFISDPHSLMHSNPGSNDANSLHLSQTATALNMTPTPGGGGGAFAAATALQHSQASQASAYSSLSTLPSTAPGATPGGGATSVVYDNHIIHGSTPLSQIGVNVCPLPSDSSLLSGQLSPAPTTSGGSADDCDSDFTSRTSSGTHSSRKQKRGVLPKHATSVMRSWLFQHLVHPYPTEDEKRNIAAQTNLTLLQVNNWFINARRRILQPMLDASAPGDNSNVQGSSQNSKKKHNSNTKRFWPDNIASLQPQLGAGVLSSSDDDCDSYSSDGEEGNLIIDAGNQPPVTNPNSTQSVDNVTGAPFSNHSSSSEHP